MQTKLNDVQLELLKIFAFLKEDKDLVEIKSLLKNYLADKVVRNADETFDERKYTSEVFEKWKKEHFRKPSLG